MSLTNVEAMIGADHLLRWIKEMCDQSMMSTDLPRAVSR